MTEYSTDIHTEQDYRYRMLVILERSDRPQVFVFHCPRCTMRICELVNSEIVAMTDIVDFSNLDKTLVGYRCGGRFQGDRCDLWLYFSLGRDV